MSGVLLVAVAVVAMGLIVTAWLRLGLRPLELWLMRVLLGAAGVSLLVFALAAAQVARKGVFIGVTVALVVAAWRCYRPAEGEWGLGFRPWQWVMGGVIYLGFGGLYAIYAFAPEISPDGATYHLGNVARWWARHGFDTYGGSLYANWNQGWEMLYLMAFAEGRHQSAGAVHWLMLMVLPWLFVALGARQGQAWLYAVAGLLVFVSPVVGIDGVSAYNDVALACVWLGVVLLLELEVDGAVVGAVGLLVGFAFAIKYTGVMLAAYAVWRVGVWWAPRMLGFAGVMVAPWLVKNALLLRNPVSPFGNEWFPNEFIHASFEREYVRSMALYSEIGSRWELPWRWAVSGDHVGGLWGPWLLLLPVGLVALRWDWGRRLWGGAALAGAVAMANCGTRFLLPAVCLAAIALVRTMGMTRALVEVVLVGQVVMSLPAVVERYAGPASWRLHEAPWRVVAGRENAEAYLARHVGNYLFTRQMDKRVPVGERVLALVDLPVAYTTREVWQPWQSALGEEAQEVLDYGLNARERDGANYRFVLDERRYQAVRVSVAGRSEAWWEVAEIEMWRRGEMLKRERHWQVSAWPEPWRATWAFDGNLASSWRSWRGVRAGDWVECRFGGVVMLDELRLVMGLRQRPLDWRVEGQRADGEWEMATEVHLMETRPLKAGARYRASAALRQMGFDYLAVDGTTEVGRDVKQLWRYWGMTPVLRVGEVELLRVPQVSEIEKGS